MTVHIRELHTELFCSLELVVLQKSLSITAYPSDVSEGDANHRFEEGQAHDLRNVQAQNHLILVQQLRDPSPWKLHYETVPILLESEKVANPFYYFS